MTENPLFTEFRGLKKDPCKLPDPMLKIKRLRPTTPELPKYATPGSAGLDLRADLTETTMWRAYAEAAFVELNPGNSLLIPTGLSIELPLGYEGQVRSRSGLALKNGIVVLNSPGTVDADYRGEVGVILHNTSGTPFRIKHGDRIAQLVIAKVEQLPIHETDELSTTDRGAGGFGSTGVK